MLTSEYGEFLNTYVLLKTALERELREAGYTVKKSVLIGHIDSPGVINEIFGETKDHLIIVSRIGALTDVLLIFAFPASFKKLKESISFALNIDDETTKKIIVSMLEEEANILSGRISGILSDFIGREILPGLSKRINPTELWINYLSPLTRFPNVKVLKLRTEWRDHLSAVIYVIPSERFLRECEIKSKSRFGGKTVVGHSN